MLVVRGWLAWGLLLVACGTEASRDARPAPEPPVQTVDRAQGLSAATPRRGRGPGRPAISREALLERLHARLSRPEGELRVQRGPDGSRRVALDGHLQHATIAVVDQDGRVHTTCVDSPAAAARVLGVDAQGPR
jgi:hypothetical protein